MNFEVKAFLVGRCNVRRLCLSESFVRTYVQSIDDAQSIVQIDSPVLRLLCRANRQMMRSMGAHVASRDTRAMMAPTGQDMVNTRVALFQNLWGCHSQTWLYTIEYVARIWDKDQNWKSPDREPCGSDLGLVQIRARQPWGSDLGCTSDLG